MLHGKTRKLFVLCALGTVVHLIFRLTFRDITSNKQLVSSFAKRATFHHSLNHWAQQLLIHNPNVDCVKLINNDTFEQKRVLGLNDTTYLNETAYRQMTKNCTDFVHKRQYIPFRSTAEEFSFPIAYSLLIHTDIERFERLLRAIYRSHNFYCIHVDFDSSDEFKSAASAIVSCLKNVFISSRSVSVQWGQFSVLEPELICMEDLLKYKSWRYFINLTGQEFPLKTNLELVRILNAFDGANNIEGTFKRRKESRTKYVHDGLTRTEVLKGPVPVNYTIFRGSVHIAAQRGFIDYVIHNENATKFTSWIKDTKVPDETLFASLNYNPKFRIPGSYIGEPESSLLDVRSDQILSNPFVTRFKNWKNYDTFTWPCHGKSLKNICIFGIGDLPILTSRKELFANKFQAKFQPQAYDCIEEFHRNRTLQEMLYGSDLDVQFYTALDFVKNHVR